MNRRATSKLTIGSLDFVVISSTVTCDANENSIMCPAKLETEKSAMIDMKLMIDCGIEGDFINQTYAMLMGIKKMALAKPIMVKNIDGTINRMGTITHYVNVTLEISERKWNKQLYVTKLGKQRIILGIPWLKRENPDINWQTGTINW